MADAFCAFEHWPRRHRCAVPLLLLAALVLALIHEQRTAVAVGSARPFLFDRCSAFPFVASERHAVRVAHRSFIRSIQWKL